MPSIGKNISTNSSSEVISSAESDSDSESSSSIGNSNGSGDEGITIPPGTASDVAVTGESTSPFFSCSLKTIVGTFCALTAIGGGILLIYGGNALNDPQDNHAGLHRAMLGTGVVMLSIGSMMTLGSRINFSEVSS
jgi:hypothetical protein